jgi:hypothetical protein
MLKIVEEKLHKATILNENEPVLCLIQVTDYSKQQQNLKKVPKEDLPSVMASISTVKPLYLVSSGSKMLKSSN